MFGPFGPFGMRFDWPEFFVGLAIGAVLAFVLGRFFPVFSWLQQTLGTRIEAMRASMMAGARDVYRTEVFARAETLHIARVHFALQEVVIAPSLLAPPPAADPLRTEPLPEDSLVVLPSLPDWTYLSGIYRAHTLPLANVLRSRLHVMITGEPGSGKTTALAYIASRLAQGDREPDEEAARVPVLLHVLDLELDLSTDDDPLDPIISAIQKGASSGLAPRIPSYLRLHFRSGNAVLLLDGLDELTQEDQGPVSTWISGLLDRFPEIQVIAAGPEDSYDGLVQAGLAPVPIAPWTAHDVRLFLDRWASAWQQHVVPDLPKKQLGSIDPTLINGWLIGTVRGLTPLELTLRAWAAHAGDVRGPSVPDSLEAFLARFVSPDERERAAAAARAWVEGHSGAIADKDLPRGTPTGDLVEAGILIRRPGGRFSFAQPAVGAYLAAQALVDSEELSLKADDRWHPARTTLAFYAGLGDAGALAEGLLNQSETHTLKTPVLLGARWLRDAPRKSAWRSLLLRGLARIASTMSYPYGLRLRATHALVRAHDPQVAALFTRMIKADARSSRVLGALGLGGMQELESVEALSAMLEQDPDLRVRQAAALGLGAIGNDAALETLGRALLEGEEVVRLAAAEALAVHPDEGYGMLREAIGLDNLMTRRAAVFGLARIPEAWAVDQLELVQVEDSQWVVRGAASEALERHQHPSWAVTAPVQELSEVPWLIEFAAREGLGVAPGQAAFEMVRRALSTGSLEEQLAAMEAIGWVASEEFVLELYKFLGSEEVHLRDAAYEALWRLEAAGVRLPERVERAEPYSENPGVPD